MGGCCSSGQRLEGFMVEEGYNGIPNRSKRNNHHMRNADSNGANVRFEGSSRFISMFSQQGRKGVNQDAMTVWENFNGKKDTYFCAVFDGHGPLGHKVAQQARDHLPAKLCSSFKQLQIDRCNGISNGVNDNVNGEDVSKNPLFSSLKASLIQSFEDVDEDLSLDSTLDAYCSGSTTVAVLKQGDHLMIANLGDSRAVLCSRSDQNQLVPVQLTVDLKPSLTNEAERIKRCEGRVFALEEEPNVVRIWMPDEDFPGLAMARAFGDFCLKDYGLISTPEVTYRKLTDRDEFVILATDGVWDVLSNNQVIKIVASARNRSTAARLLVQRAVQAWKHKYPTSKIDDCAVVCLFLRNRPLLTKSVSEASRLSKNYSDLEVVDNPITLKTDDGLDTVLNCEITTRPPANGTTKLTRSMSESQQEPGKDFK